MIKQTDLEQVKERIGRRGLVAVNSGGKINPWARPRGAFGVGGKYMPLGLAVRLRSEAGFPGCRIESRREFGRIERKGW